MDDQEFKERVRKSFDNQKFMSHIGAKIELLELGQCHIQLPYNENLTQQNGFIHAGVVSTLADNSAGYAAFSVMDSNSSVLTVEFKLNLIAPAKGEYFVAKSNVLKHGRTLTVCRSEVYAYQKGEEKLCAASQSTLIELKEQSETK